MPKSSLKDIVQRMIDAGESEDNIAKVITAYKNHPDTYWTRHPEIAAVVRGTADTLPALGAMGGGALAAPSLATGLPGVAAEAAAVGLGAGVGKGARDLAMHFMGLEPPSTPMDKAKGIAGETALAAGTQAMVPGAASYLKPVARASARVGGDWAYRIGKAAEFPLQIKGISHILQGYVPGGTAIIAAPKAIRTIGAALQSWGEAEPAYMEKQIVKVLGSRNTQGTADTPLVVNGAKQATESDAMAEAYEASKAELRNQAAAAAAKADAAAAKAQAAAVKGMRYPSGTRELDFGDIQSGDYRLAPENVMTTPRVPLTGMPATASGRVQKVMTNEAQTSVNIEARAQAARDAAQKARDVATAAARKAEENATNLAKIKQAIEDGKLKPGTPSVSTSTSATDLDGSRVNYRQPFTPTEDAGPSMADQIRAVTERNEAIAAREAANRGGFRTAAPPVNATPFTDTATTEIEPVGKAPTPQTATSTLSDDAENEAFKARYNAEQARIRESNARYDAEQAAKKAQQTPKPKAAKTPKPAAAAEPAPEAAPSTPVPDTPTAATPTPAPGAAQPGITIGGLETTPAAPEVAPAAPPTAPPDPDTAAMINHMQGQGEAPVVRESKTKRGKSGQGMSAGDVEETRNFFRDNPDGTADELAAHLDKKRAERSLAYRTQAGLDAGAKRALDNDPDPEAK